MRTFIAAMSEKLESGQRIKNLLNIFSSIMKLKKSRMNVDQVLVAANNEYTMCIKHYVSIASYLIIIIGLTVSNSGDVDLILLCLQLRLQYYKSLQGI